MTAGAPSASRPERATYLRPAGLDGVEALHASFITHRYRPHSHPTWTLAMVVRGAAAFALDDTAQRAGDGDLFLLEPESVHTGAPAVPGGWAYKVLYLDPGVFGAWAEEGGAPPGGARWVVFRDARLWRALGAAHDALASEPAGLAVDGAVLAAVDALRPHLRPGPRAPRTRPEHAAVRRARAYLDERWAVSVPLAELAAHAGLSRFELARTFRAQVGLPPHAYQLDRRIARARALLAAGEPVASVALECGFSDQPHFTRTFKRAVGVDARRVRKIVQDARRGLSSDLAAMAVTDFDTKVAVVVRDDLAAWQRINVCAFLMSGVVAGAGEDVVGPDYEDASGRAYLPMLVQPVLVFEAPAGKLRTVYERAVTRELRFAIYTADLFATGHDDDNRAAVRAVASDDLDLVGLAVRAPHKAVDGVVRGLKRHP